MLAASIAGGLDVVMVAILQAMYEAGYPNSTRTTLYCVLKSTEIFTMLLAPFIGTRQIAFIPSIFGGTILVMAFPIALEVAGHNRGDFLGNFLFWGNWYLLAYLESVVIGYLFARNFGSRESAIACILLSILGGSLMSMAGYVIGPNDDVVVDSFIRIIRLFTLLIPPAIYVEWNQKQRRYRPSALPKSDTVRTIH